MSPKVCFGRFLVDLGDSFWLILVTVGPSTSKKRRTGENVKMSTALKREAHFRGFMGVENWQKTTRNRKLDTQISRDDFGSQLGGIFDDLRLQKWDTNEVENERLALARCSFSHFHPFAVVLTSRAQKSPKWIKKWRQNRPKINQNAIFNSSFFCSIFGIDFCSKRTPKWHP